MDATGSRAKRLESITARELSAIVSTQQIICTVKSGFDAFLSHAQTACSFDDARPCQLSELDHSAILLRHILQCGM